MNSDVLVAMIISDYPGWMTATDIAGLSDERLGIGAVYASLERLIARGVVRKCTFGFTGRSMYSLNVDSRPKALRVEVGHV